MSEAFRVGLLGQGTVGSAFAALLAERADHVAAVTGLRPELSGVLTRSRGDFDDILERSDLIVELIGGIEPAREYILRAMAAGKHVVTATKAVLAQHGEEVYEAARAAGVQLRFEAAVGGVVPVIRVIHETLAAAHVERVHGIVNGTTNFILTEMARTGSMYADALRDAQQLGSAEGLDGGISVRVHPAFLYGSHPLAAVNGSFNAVTIESPAITEITLSGPGAGGSQTASAVLGDVNSAMIPPATLPAPAIDLPLATDIESA